MVKLIYTELNLKDLEEILLNKNEFINEVAKRCNVPSYIIVESFNVISNVVAERLISGETVEFPKIGRFYMVKRKEMTGKNLFGKSEKELNPCTYPSFKIFKSLKNRVKNGYRYSKST